MSMTSLELSTFSRKTYITFDAVYISVFMYEEMINGDRRSNVSPGKDEV